MTENKIGNTNGQILFKLSSDSNDSLNNLKPYFHPAGFYYLACNCMFTIYLMSFPVQIPLPRTSVL